MKNSNTSSSPSSGVIYLNNSQQPDSENILLRSEAHNNVESRTRTFSGPNGGPIRAPHIIIEAPQKPETPISCEKPTPANGHGPKKVIVNGKNAEQKLPSSKKVKKKKNTVARPPDGK